MRFKIVLVSALMLAVVFVAVSSCPSSDGFTEGNFEYTTVNGGVELTGYVDEPSGFLEIPETVVYEGKTYDVVSIGENAFYECNGLKTVRIPDSVKVINKLAFGNCHYIAGVDLGRGVEVIRSQAFLQDFIRNMTLPDSLTSIGDNAFNRCEVAELTIPSKVSYIGDFAFTGSTIKTLRILGPLDGVQEDAFGGCRELTAVHLEEGVEKMSRDMFSGCVLLKELNIPSTVERIDFPVLPDSLETLTVDPGNAEYSAYDNMLLSKDGRTMYQCAPSCREANVPEGTVALADKAFIECLSLTSVVLPDSLTDMGANVFEGDTALTSVRLSANLKSLGDNAFLGCTSLASVEIPPSVSEIGDGAFENCVGLSSFVIPGTVDTVDSYAFEGCVNLKEVVLSEGIERLGGSLFEGCPHITEVTVPASVRILFYMGDYVGSIDVHPDNKDLTSLDGVVYDKDVTQLIVLPKKVTGSYTVPETVTSVSGWEISHAPGITSLTLSPAMSELNSIPYDMSGLVTVDMKDGIEEIIRDSFCRCDKLESIHFSSSLKKCDEESFEGIEFYSDKGEKLDVTDTSQFAGKDFRGSGDGKLYRQGPALPSYTITFDTAGGTAVDPITSLAGVRVDVPEPPVKPEYEFSGWDPEVPDTMPAHDMTVKAVWKSAVPGGSDQESWTDHADTGWYAESGRLFISTPEELAGLAVLVNGGNSLSDRSVVLTDDIDLSAHQWVPIGLPVIGSQEPGQAFSGRFHADGHTVSGMWMNGTGSIGGLFGSMDGASVDGLTLEGSVKLYCKEDCLVGGISAYASDTQIGSCHSDVDITVECVYSFDCRVHAGGMVGVVFQGHLRNCLNSGVLDVNPDSSEGAKAYVGGIAGGMFADIGNCVNTGHVDSFIAGFYGGIVGITDYRNLVDCYYMEGTAFGDGVRGEHEDSSLFNDEYMLYVNTEDGTSVGGPLLDELNANFPKYAFGLADKWVSGPDGMPLPSVVDYDFDEGGDEGPQGFSSLTTVIAVLVIVLVAVGLAVAVLSRRKGRSPAVKEGGSGRGGPGFEK